MSNNLHQNIFADELFFAFLFASPLAMYNMVNIFKDILFISLKYLIDIIFQLWAIL